MKYYIDTEFHEYYKQPKVLGINIGKAIPTIDLISIGIVSEGDVVESNEPKKIILFGTQEEAIQYSINNEPSYTDLTIIQTSSDLSELQHSIKSPSKYIINSLDISIIAYLNTLGEYYSIWDYIKEFIDLPANTSKEYYAICKDFNLKDAWNNEWLRKNVLKSIWKELEYREYFKPEIDAGKITGKESLHYDRNDFTYVRLKTLLNEYGKSKEQIAKEIQEFTQEKLTLDDDNSKVLITRSKPEFYAYYADYDWVVFAQLFGSMINLPKGFPMYCKDLKQELDRKAFKLTIDDLIELDIVEDSYVEYPHKVNLTDSLRMLKTHIKYPKQDNEHNALDDAKWNRELHVFLNIL